MGHRLLRELSQRVKACSSGRILRAGRYQPEAGVIDPHAIDAYIAYSEESKVGDDGPRLAEVEARLLGQAIRR